MRTTKIKTRADVLETLDAAARKLRGARANEARLTNMLADAKDEARSAEQAYNAARSAVSEAYPSTIGI